MNSPDSYKDFSDKVGVTAHLCSFVFALSGIALECMGQVSDVVVLNN